MSNGSISTLDKATDTRFHEKQRWSWSLIFCTLLFLVCILLGIAPLQRFAPALLLSSLPVSRLLTLAGAWLPVDMHVATTVQQSRTFTANGELLVVSALVLLVYGIGAWFVLKRVTEKQLARTLLTIVAGAFIGGLLFVGTPALPSHDVFIYADYGRAIVAHGSNPYFVPSLLVSPHDPITQLDEWNYAPAAYGPLWLAFCSFFALFLGDDPVRYVFAFRLLGLVAHLLDTLLVVSILRAMGRSPRIVTLGTLLYGLNPLVLMESCLGPHNDMLMVTCMLSGIWCALRTTRITTLRGFFIPIVMMTLALLVKFTSVPLLVFFVFFLARKRLLETANGLDYTAPLAMRWLPCIRTVVLAGVVCGATILLFYGPFWVGHSIPAIVRSFTSPPSAGFAENSLLRVMIEWVKLHGMPVRSSLGYYPVRILSQHSVWSVIDVLTLVFCVLGGAILLWREPTIRNVVLATLFTLEAVLVVTPWFYSWYVLWIVGLAIILLGSGRVTWPFIAFALVFSVTGFVTYLSPFFLVRLTYLSDWLATRFVLTVVPPLLAFGIWGLVCRRKRA